MPSGKYSSKGDGQGFSKKRDGPQNKPPSTLVWLKDRHVDEAELQKTSFRILKESQKAGLSSPTHSKIKPEVKREELMSEARKNFFTIGQLAHLLSNEALASLVEQMPPGSHVPELPSLWFRNKSHDKAGSATKPKSRKPGKKRLFSSPMGEIREDNLEDSETTFEASFSEAYTPEHIKPPIPVSRTSSVSPQKIVLQTANSKEQDLPVFLYGINMFPDLLAYNAKIPLSAEELLKQCMCPATLSHFMCAQVRQADWPAIIPVGDARTRLKADLTFKTNDFFSGFRYPEYVTQRPVQLNNFIQAREIEPCGHIYEAFKKTAVTSISGQYTAIDDIPLGARFGLNDIFEVDVPYIPPAVDGMMVFGLSPSQRAKLDQFCGVRNPAGEFRRRPLYKKTRVRVEFHVRVYRRKSMASFEMRPSLSRASSERTELQMHAPPKPARRGSQDKATCTLAATATHTSSGAKESVKCDESTPFAIYPRTSSIISRTESNSSEETVNATSHVAPKTSQAPTAPMTDHEVERLAKLDRRWRADNLLQKLRPMVAAIKREDQQLDKMKKMDYIMGIMDTHQRELEVARSGLASVNTSFGSTNSRGSFEAGWSFGSRAAQGDASKESDEQYEYVPVSMEAYAYTWAGPWCALESPKRCEWNEGVYTMSLSDYESEVGSDTELASESDYDAEEW